MQALIANLGIALANLDLTGWHQVGEGAVDRRGRQLRAHEISFLELIAIRGLHPAAQNEQL
jgi:hypothetical protein